jgi:hypothetical protein
MTLYSSDFWLDLAAASNPFRVPEDTRRRFALLSRRTHIPVDRLKRHHAAWMRGVLLEPHEIQPGSYANN